ncbi:MAG: hypothetical protein AB7P04_02325 [Bacteriovoracia bacterium]
MQLRRLPIRDMKPYALVPSPVYVYLRLNQKFISIKGPLDFFLPEELERLQIYESFYVTDFVDTIAPFREAATRARAVLGWIPQPKGDHTYVSGKVSYPQVPLPPAPFELSDTMLKLTGPLWSKDLAIEPFFLSFFVDELCDPIAREQMMMARENSVRRFEAGIFRSSLAVFLALHVGYCDQDFLNDLRRRVFRETAKGLANVVRGEVEELIELVNEAIPLDAPTESISSAALTRFSTRIGQKLENKFKRVGEQLLDPAFEAPSIFGEKGFVDV